MPRPRFAKLEPEKQRALLTVAAEEFAAHGYAAASFNRIIERSGHSKGAFYYYFDDKEDLFATVMRDAMQRLVIDVGDLASATDADSFWRETERWYVRSLRLFQKEPNALGLARSLVNALARGAATGALLELRKLARGWVLGFIDQGQGLRAVRTDLPHDLLVQLVMSLEEGIDLWLGEHIGDMTEAELRGIASMLTRLYRRVTGPDEADAPAATRPRKKKNEKEKPADARRRAR